MPAPLIAAAICAVVMGARTVPGVAAEAIVAKSAIAEIDEVLFIELPFYCAS
jgi:hypothetical protein